MSDWYYNDGQQQQHGPISVAELTALHNKGVLTGDTLVWRDGLSSWKPWREMIQEVIAGAVPKDAPPSVAAQAAQVTADDGAYRPYAVVAPTPYAPPQARVANERASTRMHNSGYVVYAGFWKRFAAISIDMFLIFIVQVLMGLKRSSASFGTDDLFVAGVSLLVSLVYFAFMHAAKGATLGKMAVGIKVVRDNGEHISFLRGVARYFATFLSYITLYIGFILAAFTSRKQALHDMVCDTIVVDKHAFTDQEELQNESLDAVTIVIIALNVLGLLAVLAGILFLGIGLASMR